MVVFRGTENWKDVKADVNGALYGFGVEKMIKQMNLEDRLQDIVQTGGTPNVFTAGHSLGSARATMLNDWLMDKYAKYHTRVHSHTIGAPAAFGNKERADRYSKRVEQQGQDITHLQLAGDKVGSTLGGNHHPSQHTFHIKDNQVI